jgi:hypothetical protein
MRKTVVGAGLAVVTALVGLSGCGAGNGAASAPPAHPKAAFDGAVHADAGRSGMTVTFRLDSTPSVLSSPGSKLSAAQAQDVLDSRLVITVATANGQPLDQALATNAVEDELSLLNRGKDLVDLRFVRKVVYVRADIPALLSAYGLPSQIFSLIQSTLSGFSSQVPGIADLAQGRWVSLNLQQVEASAGLPVPTTTPAEGSKIAARFLQAISGTYNAAYTGTTSAGQHFLVTVRLRQLVDQMLSAYSSIPGLSSVPGLQAMGSTMVGRIPANLLPQVKAVVSGGRLTQLAVPINQFDTHHRLSGPLTAEFDIAGASPVTVPAGATALDPGAVARLLKSLLTSRRMAYPSTSPLSS